MNTLRNRLALAAVAVATIAVAIGIAGGRSPETIGEARLQSSLKANDGVAFTVGGVARGGGGSATAGAQAASGPRIVKNGSVDVEVREKTFGRSFARLTTIATNLGGFVSASKTFESEDVPNGTVTIRVPSEKFDELVRQVRQLGKVRAVASSGEDVTAQFTDFRARLRALEAQRDQYLALLAKATSIPDTLAVRDRLSQVQVEIEQIQGQLKLLEDKASFATLAVSVAEPGFPGERSAERSGWSKAWDDAIDGFVDGAQAIVAHSGATLLVLLCAALLATAGFFGWRAVKPVLD